MGLWIAAVSDATRNLALLHRVARQQRRTAAADRKICATHQVWVLILLGLLYVVAGSSCG